jgi:hypothetical protein
MSFDCIERPRVNAHTVHRVSRDGSERSVSGRMLRRTSSERKGSSRVFNN